MSERTVCANHADQPGYWRCDGCAKTLCGECVKALAVAAGDGFAMCRACGGKCERVSVLADVAAEREARKAEAEKPFVDRLTSMWRFPFRGDGLVMFAVGTGTIWVLCLTGTVFMPLALVLGVLLLVYLVVYSASVIVDSAGGEVEAGDWPEVQSLWSDFFKPCLLVVITGVLSYLPASLYEEFVRSDTDVVYIALMVMGSVYYPMALISVVLDESLLGFNPARVVPAIAATWRDYWVVCVAMIVLAMVSEWGDWLIYNVPVVGGLVGGGLLMYLLMFESHMLGSLYHANRKAIGWYVDNSEIGRRPVEEPGGGAGSAGGGAEVEVVSAPVNPITAAGEDGGDEIIDLEDMAQDDEGGKG